MEQRITIPALAEMKRRGEPIVMVTAYDYPSARVADEAGVDVVLVGDTAAMVVLGYDATTPVGMDEMTTMAAAVRRGLKMPLLIGHLPFGSYERSNEHAIGDKNDNQACGDENQGGPSAAEQPRYYEKRQKQACVSAPGRRGVRSRNAVGGKESRLQVARILRDGGEGRRKPVESRAVIESGEILGCAGCRIAVKGGQRLFMADRVAADELEQSDGAGDRGEQNHGPQE